MSVLNVLSPVIVSVPAKCTKVLSATSAAVPKPRLVLAVETEVKSLRLFALSKDDDNVVTASAADWAAAVALEAALVAEVAASPALVVAIPA